MHLLGILRAAIVQQIWLDRRLVLSLFGDLDPDPKFLKQGGEPELFGNKSGHRHPFFAIEIDFIRHRSNVVGSGKGYDQVSVYELFRLLKTEERFENFAECR